MPPKRTKKTLSSASANASALAQGLSSKARKKGTVTAAPPHQAPIPDRGQRKTTMDNNMTGDFEKDFQYLCEQKLVVVPPVVPRNTAPSEEGIGAGVGSSKRRDTVTPPGLPIVAGGKLKGFWTMPKKNGVLTAKKKSSLKVDVPVSYQSSADGSSGLFPSVGSFLVLRDKFQALKPKVQVDYSKPQGWITEVHIRNWKVDATMLDILQQCCLSAYQLQGLHLWNTGLTPQTLVTMATFLPICGSLTSLTLDDNPLQEADVSLLVHGQSQLNHLSLRFCQLIDVQAYGLGCALGTSKSANSRLISLNLSNNRLGDQGARHLARGLMTNRTLAILNLASNHIGDEGATALAQVLSHFPLDQEQVRARHDRKIRRANQIREKVVDKPSYAIIPGSPSPKLLMKKKRDDAFPKLQLKSRKISKMPMDGRDSKTSNTSSRRRKESLVTPDISYASRRATCVENEKELLLSLDTHPLLDVCHYRDGQIWLLGNRSLVSLNLSRNYIGEPGLSQLSDMLKDQRVPQTGQVQTGKGLRRLAVHRNPGCQDSPVAEWIRQQMMTRDPLYRTPFLTLDRSYVSPCAIPTLVF